MNDDRPSFVELTEDAFGRLLWHELPSCIRTTVDFCWSVFEVYRFWASQFAIQSISSSGALETTVKAKFGGSTSIY